MLSTLQEQSLFQSVSLCVLCYIPTPSMFNTGEYSFKCLPISPFAIFNYTFPPFLCNFLIQPKRGAVKCARESSDVPAKTDRWIHQDGEACLSIFHMSWRCCWIMVTSGWIFTVNIGNTSGCFLSVDNHVLRSTIKAKQEYKRACCKAQEE